MAHSMTKLSSVAADDIVQEGRVLMVRRRVREGQPSWQFPAYKVEPSESREDAAVREAREETGLHVAAVQLLGVRIHPMTGRLMSYYGPLGEGRGRPRHDHRGSG